MRYRGGDRPSDGLRLANAVPLSGSDHRHDGRAGRRRGLAARAEDGRPSGRGRQRGHRPRRGRAPAVRHHRRCAVRRRVQHQGNGHARHNRRRRPLYVSVLDVF